MRISSKGIGVRLSTIYHQLQSEKREKRRSSYMSLMINDLLVRSIIAFLFRVDIESAPQWLSEEKEKEMQRLKIR